MIPGLNDAEMEQILEEAAGAGAIGAGMTLLRLPLELSDLFTNWLNTHLPERANHVLSLIRQMRGGKLNESNFHARFAGQGPYAEMLKKRFSRAARQYGLNAEKFALDCTKFSAPDARKEARQLSLF